MLLRLRIFCLSLSLSLLLSACTPKILFTINTGSVEAVASHQGWIQARALGGRSVASQSADLVTSSAYVNNGWNTPSVTLGWNPMIIPNATVTSYNVYRSNFSGAENYSSPLATGISASTNSFTDTSVNVSTDYYYVVRPVSGPTEFQTTDSDTEIKIMVPPVNMSLVHRWIANLSGQFFQVSFS
jgi:hypothetical protein